MTYYEKISSSITWAKSNNLQIGRNDKQNSTFSGM